MVSDSQRCPLLALSQAVINLVLLVFILNCFEMASVTLSLVRFH
jgi:hypothetical protein